MKFSGKIWVLTTPEGCLVDDIDTDMIFHNRYLAETDIEKMGQYALDNLEGWEDFANRTRPGDILIAGKNFGAGSSRQQAVDCFRSLKIALLIAESFGAIYKRNAINSAFPILEAPGIGSVGFQTGDVVDVNSETGAIRSDRNVLYHGRPFSKVQLDILSADGLFQYAREMEK